jgi:hypothetical protein
MQTITLVMMVYCAILAGLVLGFAVYRAMKRRREMRALAGAQTPVPQTEGPSLPQATIKSDSPHDAPSAKHAA